MVTSPSRRASFVQSNLVPDAEFLDLTTQKWVNTSSIPNVQVTSYPMGVTGYAHQVVSSGSSCAVGSERALSDQRARPTAGVWIKSTPTMHNYLGFNVYDADKVKLDHYAIERVLPLCKR